jgi:V/A-type H+-transporting ATPase subunit C
MGDLHFLNARIRALRGRLLGRREIARISLLPDLPSIVSALRGGPYGRALEEAGARDDDAARLEEGIRREFSGTLSRVLAMAGEECGKAVRRLLGFWEARAIRAVLRGQAARRPAEEILSAVLPTGLHDEAAIEALCRQPGVGAAVDLLSTWGDPCAAPLRRALGGYRGPEDIRLLEAALDRHFLGGAPGLPAGERDDVDLFLSLAADRTNLVAALVAVSERNPSDAFRRAFVPGGAVYGEEDFEALLSAASVPEAMSLAARAAFAPVLKEILAREGVPSLPSVERQLDRVPVRCLRARMRVDPLGYAPVAHYLLEKEREAADLRAVFRGRLAGLDEAVLAGLVAQGA